MLLMSVYLIRKPQFWIHQLLVMLAFTSVVGMMISSYGQDPPYMEDDMIRTFLLLALVSVPAAFIHYRKIRIKMEITDDNGLVRLHIADPDSPVNMTAPFKLIKEYSIVSHGRRDSTKRAYLTVCDQHGKPLFSFYNGRTPKSGYTYVEVNDPSSDARPLEAPTVYYAPRFLRINELLS